MSLADAEFFGASVGRDKGFTEERVSEAFEKLKTTLQKLEVRLQGRDYLADVAHAGNFVRLRELGETGEVSLDEYPNVAAWMERLESRESY